MIVRRITMRLSTASVALLLLALTSSSVSAASTTHAQIIATQSKSNIRASSSRTPTSPITTSRWLTYACNSHTTNLNSNGGGNRRSLLSRILTHPCTSTSRQSTTTQLYNQNNNKTSSTFLNVSLGILSSILILLTMLYIVDHETFTQLTGMRIKWSCNPQCSRFKRRADSDEETEDSYTNYERDVYLTESTKDYMVEQHDTKVEQPKRKLRKIFWCCFQTKTYTGDKYHIPWSESQSSSDQGEGGGVSKTKKTKDDGITKTIERDINVCVQFFEEIRLRLFWRTTKKFNPNVDKYQVGDEDEDGEIKYAASSYESAAVGDAPW